MERIPNEASHHEDDISRHHLQLLVGSICVAFAIVACSDQATVSDNVRFNQPRSAEYYLDTSDPYFNNLELARDSTHNVVVHNNIDQLLETPVAQWLNGNEEYSRQLIRENISGAEQANQIPVFVVYNIPNRDLGGEAKGGIETAKQYQAWIEALSDEIDDANTILIFEPDALAGIPMMSSVDGKERLDILRHGLETLRDNNPNTATYLDAGNHVWNESAVIADLIQQLENEPGLVAGISLNVSNQMSEASERKYLAEISRRLGRPLYGMIDNSMNGAENTDKLRTAWCNVKGEHIGTLDDTFYDADSLVETMYIKAPGESDGRCGESKSPAGEFDEQLLIKQVS